MVRTTPEPRGDRRHGRPPPHVPPALAAERQRRRRVKARERGQRAPRPPMAGAAPVDPRAMACSLAWAPQRQPGGLVLARGPGPERRGDLLGLQIIEGPRVGSGNEGRGTPRAVARVGEGRLVLVAARLAETGPRHRGPVPRAHSPHERPPGLPRPVPDDRLALPGPWRQGCVPRLAGLAGIGPPPGPLPQRAAPPAHLGWGAARASQPAHGRQPWSPRAGGDVACGPPLALLPLVRLAPPHRNTPARHALTPREPSAPGRCQGAGGAPARGQPGSHARSGARRRATAAPRLGRVTGGHRHTRRCGAHSAARRRPVDGGPLGGPRGRGARRWRLPPGHGALRHHRASPPWQWGRERRRCRTLPHGIRSRPVPTGVAPDSRDHPHPRAQSPRAPTASHGPLPACESTAVCTPGPGRCTAAQRHNHPHTG